MVYPRTKVALVENHSKIVYGARPSPYKRPNTARSPQRALPAGRSLPLSNEKAKSGVKVALRGLPTAPLQSPFGCPSLRSASPLRAFIRSGTSPAIRSKPLFSASGSLAPPPPFKVSPLAISIRFELFGWLSLLKRLRSIHSAHLLSSQSGGFSLLCGFKLVPLMRPYPSAPQKAPSSEHDPRRNGLGGPIKRKRPCTSKLNAGVLIRRAQPGSLARRERGRRHCPAIGDPEAYIFSHIKVEP
jgi:hypothetical protein